MQFQPHHKIVNIVVLISLLYFLCGVLTSVHASQPADYLNSIKSYPIKNIGPNDIPYQSLDSIKADYSAKGYHVTAESNMKFAGTFCEGQGAEDCGNYVQLEKECPAGGSIVKEFNVECDGNPKDPTAWYPCYILTAKALNPGSSTYTENGVIKNIPSDCPSNTNSPTPVQTPIQNMCSYPPDVEQKRQEIFNYINTKYNFKVADTNVCGQLPDCGNGNNPLWPPDDLNNLRNFLDSLPSCFINRLNLRQIEGLQWSPSVENNWDPNSLGQREGKAACCSQEAKDNCNVAHYWGQGYNHIIVCGDMYKNGVDHTGTACSQYFSLEGVLAHEMTHALQFNAAPGIVIQPQIYNTPLMISWIFQTGWTTSWGEAGKIFCTPVLGCNLVPPNDLPSAYAKRTKDPTEDMAESVRLYYEHPDQLKQISQRRYDFVKNQIMCGKEFNNGQ